VNGAFVTQDIALPVIIKVQWRIPDSCSSDDQAIANRRIMTVTIEDISTHLGISVSTVSKALNGYPDVSESTRRHVLQTAQELGYQPSAAARNLRRGQTDKIGLLINHSLSYISEYLAEVIAGVAFAAEEHGKNIILYTRTIDNPG
jgi:DNA-binding LacI/PurR family transcriptional regulator